MKPGGESAVGEHRLDQRLGVVEAAIDRDIVDVAVAHRGHLAPLDRGNAARRVEHEHVDLGPPGERVDRRRAGVARGRADHGQMRVAGAEEALEQQPEQLQRDILERQGRPVEQLEQPVARVELDQRRDRGVIEPAIGRLAQSAQLGRRQRIADKRLHHASRRLDIGQAGERGDLVMRQAGPGVGHVEPAVGSEPGESHRLEIKRGRAAAGADVAHGGGA